MSRPEPKYADPDARIRAQRLHSAWESWRLDSDADLALSESEDACRCDDALQAGEILERQYLLLETVSEVWACACWSAWDLIDDRPATLIVLSPSVSPEDVDFHHWVAAGSHRHPPLIRQGGRWRGFHWHALEGSPGGGLGSAQHRALRPLTVLGQVLNAVGALLEDGRHHGHLVPGVFVLPPGGPVWLIGHSLGAKGSDLSLVVGDRMEPSQQSGSDARDLALTLLSVLVMDDAMKEEPEEALALGLHALPPLPEFQVWRDALKPGESISVERLFSEIMASPCVQHSLAREAAARGDWERVSLHLDPMISALDAPPVDALVLRARALERLEVGDPVAAWREVLSAHQTREQAYEALRALAVLAPEQMSLAEGMWLTALGEGLLESTALQERLGELMLQEGNREAAASMLVQAAMKGLDDAGRLQRVLSLLKSVQDWRGWLVVATATLQRHSDPSLEEEVSDVQRLLFRKGFTSEGFKLAGEGSSSLRWRCTAKSPKSADLLALRSEGSLSPSQWIALLGSDPAKDGKPGPWLDEALAEYPHHPGLLRWRARGLELEGDRGAARETWQAIADRTEGMGHAWWVEAQHALAEDDWLENRAQDAAERWHSILNLDDQDRRAWWGLTRVTWLPSAVSPISVLPAVAPAEEALTRLLTGLVPQPLLQAWLAQQPGMLSDGCEQSLDLAARVVEMLRGQIGTELFDLLGQSFPEAALAVEATRLLFGPEQDRAPVDPEDTYLWTQDDPATILGVRRSWLFAGTADLASIRLTSNLDGLLAEHGETRMIEAALEEPATLWTEDSQPQVQLRDEQGHVWVLSGSDQSLGGGDLDDHVIPLLGAGRMRAHHEGGHWYISSKAAFLADHRRVEEVRLREGLRLDVDVIRLMVRVEEGDERIEPAPQPVIPEGPITQQSPDAVLRIADRQGRPLASYELSGSVIYIGSNPAQGPVRKEEDWWHCIRRTGGLYSVSERMRSTLFSVQSAAIPERTVPPDVPMPVGDYLWSFHDLGEPDSLPVNGSDEEAVALMRLVASDGSTRDVWIEGEFYSIGRGEDMQLRLKGDPKASRHHCTIVQEAGGKWTLRDFGSANGTFVNGARTEAHTLTVGDSIEVGSVTLVFMGADDDADDVELLELD